MKTLFAGHIRFVTLLAAFTVATLARGAADYATPYAFTTLAGTSSIGSQDGTGSGARFFSPRDVTTDAAGNFYVADEGNHIIRKITSAGVVTTIAGSPGEPGATDGTGSAARFDSPHGIVADASGNLYIADTGNHIVRKITPAGAVTTLAGSAGLTGNADGTGSAARFNRPQRLAIDSSGNLYVTESGNGTVRKVTPTGVVTTFARDLQFPEAADIHAQISVSYGAVAVDAAGNVYVSDYLAYTEYNVEPVPGTIPKNIAYYGSVRKLTPAGGNTRLWDTAITQTWEGRIVSNGDVTALAFDAAGQLVCSQGYLIRRFAPQSDGSPAFVTLAGDGTIGSSDGSAASAKFGFPMAFAYDRSGNLIIADTGNNVVRKLSAAGEVTTIAGVAFERATGTADGTSAAARFVAPTGIVADATGNLYVADTSAHVIRKIAADGVVTTVAGSPGQSGYDDGIGTAARFNAPRGIAFGPDGALYVTDSSNHTIRRVALDGTTTTYAGEATASGWSDGPRLTARFMFPFGLSFDPFGNLYVTSAATVRKISPAGEVTTLAGLNSEIGNADGIGSAARFTAPYGITTDTSGNVYVTEAPSSPAIARLRKITPTGMVSTIAGAEQGYADGATATARFDVPSAIAIDANHNLFVADYANQVIRKISATGTVSTVAGLVDALGSTDGVGRDARFFYPQGVVVDSAGALYVTSGTTVRKGVLASGPTITTQPASQSVVAGASVTFTVAATGTPTPTYQWQFNGVAIAGATGASLTMSSARAADAGDYTVVVTNAAGSVTSNKATLTVTTATTPPPSGGGGSSGGGGAPSHWFVALVASVALARAWQQRRR